MPMPTVSDCAASQDYNIYAWRTSNGPVPEDLYLSTEPAHRYQIHLFSSLYSLFQNRLIRNEGSYWLLQILWFGTVIFEINYILLCRSQCRSVCLSAPNMFQKHSASIEMGAVLSPAFRSPCAIKTMMTDDH